MSRQRGRLEGVSRRLAPALAVVGALLVASSSPAATGADMSASGGPSAKAWCALVIKVNTKYGTMKNKHYLPQAKVPLSSWKKVVDAAVKGRRQILAVTPSAIKTAQIHQLDWFKRVQANYYSAVTSLAPMTIADVRLLTNFQKTKCGITF